MDGDYQYDARKGVLMWTIDLIDSSNQSGTMEFVVPKAQADDFFPVDVIFSANRTLCKVCGRQTPVWICKPDAVQRFVSAGRRPCMCPRCRQTL